MEAGSFVFDANRCTGCGACRLACTIENRLPPSVSWRRIETFNPRREPAAPVFHLSIACNHCETAVCMHACPALAYRRDPVTGAVLLESSRCIGCGYCSWACPYDAPVFDDAAGVMTKCTWCTDRLKAGLKPACATHCPTGALDYAVVPASGRHLILCPPSLKAGSSSSDVGSVSLDDTGLNPSLHVIALKPGRTQPEMDMPPEAPGDMTVRRPALSGPAFAPGDTTIGRPGDTTIDGPGLSGPAGVPLEYGAMANEAAAISLRREWPLAVFTLGAAILVGVAAGAASGMLRVAWWGFAASAVVIMGVAGVHLGRPERGWRAMLNVRRSWLSREIVAMTLFAACATLWLYGAASAAAGWFVVAVGFVALYAADRVYAVLPSGPGYRHSAGVLLTGALFAALFAQRFALALAVLAVKLLLYSRPRPVTGLPWWLPALRIAAGMLVPLTAWRAGMLAHPAALACVALAEAVDRCEFYMHLERRTPRRVMDCALVSARPRLTARSTI